MSFPSFANGRWIRQRYSYVREERTGISVIGTVWSFPTEYRHIERMIAVMYCAGVDSQTVAASIGSTLPTVYIPGGGSDSLSGTTGWDVEQPEISDGGGHSVVTASWVRTTAWAEVT